VGKCEIKGEGRRFVALLFALGLLHVAIYYFSAACVNGVGHLAIPQPDTLLYCQAARRICEGHAFSFTTGTAVSTGTTSVLYPFALAALHAIGFTGTSLFAAGFWLNAGFYLLFLLGWGLAFRRLFPRPFALFASILLVLFHQPAYCALAQSDTGLWMAVSGLLAAALAANRAIFIVPLLLVGPWVRPEGAILVACFGFVALLRRNRREILFAALGALSVLGLILFNRHLTGAENFSSVSNKGFFLSYPYARAVLLATAQFFVMLQEVVFGMVRTLPRGFYLVPVLGPIALLVGVSVFAWRKRGSLVPVFTLAALGDFFLVAQSGYQGTNNDRYLSWMMPLIVLFGSLGWWQAYLFLKGRAHVAQARLCLVVPLVFSFLTLFAGAFSYHAACFDTERHIRYFQEVDRHVPDSASLGSGGWCGAAYLLGNRRIANLGGVYSPEFAARKMAGVVEILKNEPAVRFDYWLLSPEDRFPSVVMDTMGSTEIPGPAAFEFRRTDWKAFDVALTEPMVSNCTLRCRVDVGYEREMSRARYEVVSCYGMTPFEPLVVAADLRGATAVDTGLMVVGYDEMDVTNLTPGKEVLVVIRTMDAVDVCGADSFGSGFKTKYSFKGPMGLHLSVDGREVACCHAHIEKKGFTDIVLKLPGRFVTDSRHRIGIHGDHPAFCYWFYQ